MSSGQQFNLRWNNHTNNILQVFMEQFASEHLVDVTLSCQGQFLKAHKMILSACSPYFQELFRQHQVQHPVIIMNGMKFVDIKLVVEFMYRGEIKVLETELDGLLATAETLQVKGLSNVRNKYEKGDIQGSEQQPHASRLDQLETSDHTLVSPGTPMHLRRKRRKRSDSPAADVPDSGDKDGDTITTIPANSSANTSSEKGLQPFVQVTMKAYGEDDDLPATIKVEPPDIRDIDEEPSGWESPKLVIDLPDSGNQSKPNSATPKPSPRANKPETKASPDVGKPRFITEFSQITPGTSQDNGDLAHQLLENQRDRKQVSQWLRKRTGKIPRPPNAFMIFANEWRRKLAFQHPTESNKEISVRLGIMWKNLSSDTKESYYTASRQADEEHKRKYPGYYYSPKEARLRKTLKHDLAMARKGPKAVEAMHLVKVLMTDGNDNPPYVLLQDSSQLGQPKETHVHIARKKSPRVVRHEVPENQIQPDQIIHKDVLDTPHQVIEAVSSHEGFVGEQYNTEVDLTEDK